MEIVVQHVSDFLRLDPFVIALTGAVIGVASHLLYWSHGLKAPQSATIFYSHLLTFTLINIATIKLNGVSHGILASWALIGSYMAGVFTSMTIYRVFFHRLRRFPGPFPAKVTKMYSIWVAKKCHPYQKVVDICDKYGDIVRTGPMELVLRSAEAVQLVHGGNSKCTKRGMGLFEIFDWDGGFSLEAILDADSHRVRRRIWDRAQNPEAMARYEVSTRKAARTWLAKLAEDGEDVEMSKAMTLVAFDNMGQVGFSHEFEATTTGEGAKWINLMGGLFEAIASVGGCPWPTLIAGTLEKLGKLGPLKSAIEFNDISIQIAHQRLNSDDPDLHDIFKYFIEDYKAEKPKSFLKDTDLYTDTQTILIAATDTSSATLTWLFYYLAMNPDVKHQLVEELMTAYGKTIPGEFTDADLSHLPYLNAVIYETLRIKPVGGNNSPRLTPPEGIMVEGTWIPGHTQVFTPIWALCTYEKYFVKAHEFHPERWTTKPEMVKDRRAFIPFNHGRWSCGGKRVAMLLMRHVVAYTLVEFDFGFAPGEDGTAIIRDTRDVTLVKPGKLRLRFTKRSA